MLTSNKQIGGRSLAEMVRVLYSEGQQDYFLEPLILVDSNKSPVGRIKDGDSVIFCCRRGEREIQLTEAFTDHEFEHFIRPDLKNLSFVTLTMYHEKFKNLPIAFSPSKVKDTLPELVSRAGLRQLRVSESEKYAHITFFLNGGAAEPFKGEEGLKIPSPKGISFDQVPELSLEQVSEKVIEGINENYDFIATNFANGDVIGHSTNNEVKIECASIVDLWLREVVDAAINEEYVVMITADHGTLEMMVKPDGGLNSAHTTNPVPFIVIDPLSKSIPDLRDGKLSDIAPTILSAIGIKQPDVMSGENLASEHNWEGQRRILLVILDGWGIGKNDRTNPIFLAHTPFWDNLIKTHANSQLSASGESVGLKIGKAGNSEAGHINIGAGRIVLQDDQRLDLALKDGSFYTNGVFCKTMNDVKEKGTDLHLISLLSEKSSHGSIDYPLALLKMAKEQGLRDVYLHLIIDGRSTDPGSAPELLEKFEEQIGEIGLGKIVSGVGRGIALDRDRNYSKTERAFNGFVLGEGRQYTED